jgi:hypothetical protein
MDLGRAVEALFALGHLDALARHERALFRRLDDTLKLLAAQQEKRAKAIDHRDA